MSDVEIVSRDRNGVLRLRLEFDGANVELQGGRIVITGTDLERGLTTRVSLSTSSLEDIPDANVLPDLRTRADRSTELVLETYSRR